MRRAEQKRKIMEVQNNRDALVGYLSNSQFAQKLLGIPMFKAAVDTAGGAYVKVKDSNVLVGKSIELALNISDLFVDRLAPIAKKGIDAASPLTTKVDAIAAKSLDGLIARVPVINEQPQEIVQHTITPLKECVTTYTAAALNTWPVQSAMDVYETILTTACNALGTVEKGSVENGLSEDEKHKRGIVLAIKTYNMFTTAFRRVFGICQTQMGNAAQATDLVYKQVHAASDVNNEVPLNGESNKGKKSKKGKNNQESVGN